MEKNDKVKKNKKNDKDQKQHQAQHGFDPIVDKSPARDTDQSLLMETPFYSRMDEHAATLSRIPFTVQRQEYIMRLNNTYGLRYVQRLLESVNGQAKLTVSSPGDIYEQEADKVADEVTQKINIQAQRQEVPEEEELIQGKLDIQRQEELEEEELLQAKLDIQKQEEEEEEEEIQAQRQEEEEEEEEEIQAQRQEEEEEELVQVKRDENAEADVADEIEMRINNAKGSGHSLSGEVKKPMEQAFGTDFSNVKIHTDTEADTLNKQLNAKAFTTGKDIFFRDGEYSPGSDGGKKLIAHELTHVVQQNSNVANRNSIKTQIQRWTWDGIKDNIPDSTNNNLQGYKIYKMDTLAWTSTLYKKRWFPFFNKKVEEPQQHYAKAYHSRQSGEIGISRDFDDNEAAATIVHEATHAEQYNRKESQYNFGTLIEREIEAHIEEEKFRIAHDMQPKTYGIAELKDHQIERNKDGSINEQSVEDFVRWRYRGNILKKEFYYLRQPEPVPGNFQNKELIHAYIK